MTIKIGINGFGRMGRLSMRAAFDWHDVEIVHIKLNQWEYAKYIGNFKLEVSANGRKVQNTYKKEI